MAYSTGGSGSGLTDLMDAIRAFALGLGWTIDKWDAPNRLLFMSKGIATITMKGDLTQTRRQYSGVSGSGVFADVADGRIYFAMGTANDAGSLNYYGHPGSPVLSAYDTDAPLINHLEGPYIGWFLFADPTVSDHIHVVVQISAEVYKHFSLGFVDKKGLTHAGVAYVTTCPTPSFRTTSVFNGASNGQHNWPGNHHLPFQSWSDRAGAIHSAGSYEEAPPILLKNSDAWPALWLGPVASKNGSGTLFGTSLTLNQAGTAYQPSVWPAFHSPPRLLHQVVQAEPAPYSNTLPLFHLPCFRLHYNSADPDSRRICYVGDFPNVRACNMTNLAPGQEITVDTDDYKVFPVTRQEQWANSRLFDAPTSGQFAIAYKKVP